MICVVRMASADRLCSEKNDGGAIPNAVRDRVWLKFRTEMNDARWWVKRRSFSLVW